MFHRRAELREAVDASWEVALPLSGLREGEMVGLCLAGREVLLVNLGAEGIHAYNDQRSASYRRNEPARSDEKTMYVNALFDHASRSRFSLFNTLSAVM
jgi:hypothetical protein